ncbi:MAG: trehalase family glycosidase, partial [Armatimonadota bacterium]
YGVSHTINPRTRTEESTLPLIVWEAWNAYLWSADRDFLAEAYESGKRNHEWWLKTRDRCGEGLCHYINASWESARDDNDLATWTATGGAQFQEALDLNCYLLMQEWTLGQMAHELGREHEASAFDGKALDRAKLMNAYMWHDEDQCYYGIGEVAPGWARVKDISTFFPLWAGLAPNGRFAATVKLLDDPETFGTPYGPPVLAANELGFGPEKHWMGANWVEMTALVIQGVKRYGYFALAAKLAYQNTKMVFDELEKSGHFREYFNSIDGSGVDLVDYVWTAMPAHFILHVFFGIEPTAEGLEILPALPIDWANIEIKNLSIRGKRISLCVSKHSDVRETYAVINGNTKDPFKGRGVLIPWDELKDEAQIRIIQPFNIHETHLSPAESPRDWSDVPPHQYPTDAAV